jgi:predicted unusual protein kinase regulating ubiquinone biosynthesis (AarF/ABC1/UbiB family)
MSLPNPPNFITFFHDLHILASSTAKIAENYVKLSAQQLTRSTTKLNTSQSGNVINLNQPINQLNDLNKKVLSANSNITAINKSELIQLLNLTANTLNNLANSMQQPQQNLSATHQPNLNRDPQANNQRFPPGQPEINRLANNVQSASAEPRNLQPARTRKARASPPPPPTSAHSMGHKAFIPRERAVPSGALSRFLGFAGIAAKMVTGTISDGIKGLFATQSPPIMTQEGSKGLSVGEMQSQERHNAHAELEESEKPRPKSAESLLNSSESEIHPKTDVSSATRAYNTVNPTAGITPIDSTPANESNSVAQPTTAPTAAPTPASTILPTNAAIDESRSPESSATPSSASPGIGRSIANAFISEANTERLAEGLCRMRGAALKVGQMLSIQDENLLPPRLQEVLDRVRNGADVMPRAQLDRALINELGADWRPRLQEFDYTPIAAASIGQVHRVELLDGRAAVMKVQYPGVAESMNSDVNNVRMLIKLFNVLPRGLYLDDIISAAKEELAQECDYDREAESQKKFKGFTAGDPALYVPEVISELSTRRIITSEFVQGFPIDRVAIGGDYQLDQSHRNELAANIIRLCLNELFVWRFMQTDPNWSNFLYDPKLNRINLIDFGASRGYSKLFVDDYIRMVYYCTVEDSEKIIESSIRLGFLNGEESREMLAAHVEAGIIAGKPFATEGLYDFSSNDYTARMSQLATIMMKSRLIPPPKAAYTLHRKMAGATLTAKKLGAKINCREAWLQVYNNYKFGPEKVEEEAITKDEAQLIDPANISPNDGNAVRRKNEMRSDWQRELS